MRLRSTRVVGTGSIGGRYLRLLAACTPESPWAVPVGGVLRDPTLESITRLEGPLKRRRPVVDLTIIATRTGRHVDDFLAYAPSSRSMLIEKPVAPNMETGLSILGNPRARRAAVSAPLRFMEGFQWVTDQLARAGRILDVEVICQSWLPHWRPNTDYRKSYSASTCEGGVLRDLVHEIDYSLLLFGAPKAISATLSSSPALGIEAETCAQLTWFYPGFDLRMVLDFASLESRRHLTVRGERATIVWNVLEGIVTTHAVGESQVQVARFPDDLARDTVLLRQVSAVSAHLKDRRVCTVSDGLRALGICDIARHAHRSGGVVPLEGEIWGSQ